MLAQAFEQPAESFGIGGRRAVVVAHVAVRQRCAGLEGRVRRLDLLGTEIGTAGLSVFCGSEPVIATVMMHGVDIERRSP